jgi:hypothetical protein
VQIHSFQHAKVIMTTTIEACLGLTTLNVRKPSWGAVWPFLAALLGGTLMAVALWQRPDGPAKPARPLNDWDIPQLVSYLNGQGLGLRLVPAEKDGVIDREAFLTTTDQDWSDLNVLPKLRERIHCWQGTLYCLRNKEGYVLSGQVDSWGDCCLVAGPFLFFGDRELLARVRAALSEPASSGDSFP